jgi:hypothetical protein
MGLQASLEGKGPSSGQVREGARDRTRVWGRSSASHGQSTAGSFLGQISESSIWALGKRQRWVHDSVQCCCQNPSRALDTAMERPTCSHARVNGKRGAAHFAGGIPFRSCSTMLILNNEKRVSRTMSVVPECVQKERNVLWLRADVWTKRDVPRKCPAIRTALQYRFAA